MHKMGKRIMKFRDTEIIQHRFTYTKIKFYYMM